MTWACDRATLAAALTTGVPAAGDEIVRGSSIGPSTRAGTADDMADDTDLRPVMLPAGTRIALGVAYRGVRFQGWQSQPGGRTVQDVLEHALAAFADTGVRTVCAGRTDAGVHALNQVVHFDTPVTRTDVAWVRGTNRHLPDDVAVQWCRPVDPAFHARHSAVLRRYSYVLRQSPVRPSLETGLVGWSHRPLDGDAMRAAVTELLGEHDFSAFRAAQCQAASPVRRLHSVDIGRRGAYWRFDFAANAFLHHMVRNLIGSLVAVGSGSRAVPWIGEVLRSRDRSLAAPTHAADGLYFVGPSYPAPHSLPTATDLAGWLPEAP